MSIFHRAMDRLADFIWTGRKVNLRFTAEYRTACFVAPLIRKPAAISAMTMAGPTGSCHDQIADAAPSRLTKIR